MGFILNKFKFIKQKSIILDRILISLKNKNKSLFGLFKDSSLINLKNSRNFKNIIKFKFI